MSKLRQWLNQTGGLVTALALLLPCLNATASFTLTPGQHILAVECRLFDVGRNAACHAEKYLA